MSSTWTAAGDTLFSRNLVAGVPTVIDKMIFAYVEGLDSTASIDPDGGIPEGAVVFEYDIPEEYRSWISPNLVVYSALLGSDIGNFNFNWQGLYCSAGETLVAVSTFPTVKKTKTDAASGTTGNNVTRNFMLPHTSAREGTGITVEAATWQLDFTVRLKGIDERMRLSNRDFYGRAHYFDAGWLLAEAEGAYSFTAGSGYIEGIRIAIDEPLPFVPAELPCSVWLDVSMQGAGSDIVAVITPVTAGLDEPLYDYLTPAPVVINHYLQKVAEIDASGAVTDWRAPLQEVEPEEKSMLITLEEGIAGALHAANNQFLDFFLGKHVFSFLVDTAMPGFIPVTGTKVDTGVINYPRLAYWLRTEEGRKLCVSEAEWQELSYAFWATLADGTKIGWDGIGGVCRYVLDLNTGSIRVPDLRGMAMVFASTSLGVGEVEGDMSRRVTGTLGTGAHGSGYAVVRGVFVPTGKQDLVVSSTQIATGVAADFDNARMEPVGVENTIKNIRVLPCIYAGTPA